MLAIRSLLGSGTCMLCVQLKFEGLATIILAFSIHGIMSCGWRVACQVLDPLDARLVTAETGWSSAQLALWSSSGRSCYNLWGSTVQVG